MSCCMTALKLENGMRVELIYEGFADLPLAAWVSVHEKDFRKAGFLPAYLTEITRGRFCDSPLGGACHPLIGSCFLFPEGDQSSRGGPCSRSSEVIFPRAPRTLSAAGPKAFQMPLTSHDGPLCGF